MMPIAEASVVPNSSFPSMETELSSGDMDLSMYDGDGQVGLVKPSSVAVDDGSMADMCGGGGGGPGGYTVEDGRTYLNLQAAHSRAASGGTLPAINTFSRSLPFHCDQPEIMNSWKTKHPDNWTSGMVVDWVYTVASCHGIDGVIRGEAFRKVTGTDLRTMGVDDFNLLSEEHGHLFYQHCRALLTRTNFEEPELASSPMLTDIPRHYALTSLRQALGHTNLTARINAGKSADDADRLDLSPFEAVCHTTVAEIDGDRYIFDANDNFMDLEKTRTADTADEGYSSEGSDRTNVITHTDRFRPKLPGYNYPQPIYSPAELQTETHESEAAKRETSPAKCAGRKSPCRVEKGSRSATNKPTRGRKPGQTTRGTHLWEFVRDMLKDKQYNPKLIKWEDRDNGVFRFVQSGSVAKLWGRQKGNASMTYEKLSRAMRFCRTADYFADIPKGGSKYPKKLCFRFGSRAYGWQTDN